MKFSVAVQDLQYGLRMVKDIKLVMGQLEGTCAVLMQVGRTKIVFTAYNGESLVRTTIPTISDGEMDFVIDSSAVYSAISMFQPMSNSLVGTTDIFFTFSDKTRKLTFSAETHYANGTKVPHKRTVALLAREAFPDFSSLDNLKTTFTTKAARLTYGIDAAAFALSNDKNNLIFTGMLFRAEEGKLRQVATNGICLAEHETSAGYEGKPLNIVVPGAVSARITKSFSDDENVEVCVTDRHIFVRNGTLLVGGPLIRDEFPDYKAVVKPAENRVRINKSVLVENLINLSYESSSIPDNRVTMGIKEGTLALKCGGSENEGISCSGYKGSISIDCNLKLLVSSVKNLYGDDIEIGFSTPSDPVHFFSTEKLDDVSSFSCLMVPLSPEY